MTEWSGARSVGRLALRPGDGGAAAAPSWCMAFLAILAQCGFGGPVGTVASRPVANSCVDFCRCCAARPLARAEGAGGARWGLVLLVVVTGPGSRRLLHATLARLRWCMGLLLPQQAVTNRPGPGRGKIFFAGR